MNRTKRLHLVSLSLPAHLALILALVACPGWVLGQAKRGPKSAVAPAKQEKAMNKAADAEASLQKPVSEALDISGLEQQYWAPKDTDFSVVQNRLFKKEQRWSLGAVAGPIVNDKYASGLGLNVSGTYYLTERSAVELNYLSVSLQDSPAVVAFREQHKTYPDHNWFHNYLGINYIMVPLYGKVSLFDEQIVYFDLAISAGGGLVTYATRLPVGNYYVGTGALDLNITQTFFVNNHVAVRFDLRNLWYYEDVHQYNDANNVYPFKRRALNNTTFLMLGVTYYH